MKRIARHCVDKAMARSAKRGLRRGDCRGQRLADASIQIAEEHGARVLRVSERGYGAALRAESLPRGPFIIMEMRTTATILRTCALRRKLREGLMW